MFMHGLLLVYKKMITCFDLKKRGGVIEIDRDQQSEETLKDKVVLA
jgi:hypothetical protein